MKFIRLFVAIFLVAWAGFSMADQCGRQANGALCAGGLCCSQFGVCGTGNDFCCPNLGCQSQCWHYTDCGPLALDVRVFSVDNSALKDGSDNRGAVAIVLNKRNRDRITIERPVLAFSKISEVLNK